MIIKPSEYKRKWVSMQHPYGYALTQSNKKFGYIRISKNASSTIASIKSFGLSEWVEIDNFNSNIYSIVRNPIDRFFSGVPETLSRYRPTNPLYPDNMGSRDVYISNDIFEQLQNIQIIDLKKFLIEYLDILKFGGFFDAHHEPQVNFLTKINGHYYRNLNLFSLENIDLGLSDIAKKFNLKEFGGLQNTKRENSGASSEPNKFIKYFQQGFRFSNIENELLICDPIRKWSELNKIPVKYGKKEFYNSIKYYKDDKVILDRIMGLYVQDHELHKEIYLNKSTIVSIS